MKTGSDNLRQVATVNDNLRQLTTICDSWRPYRNQVKYVKVSISGNMVGACDGISERGASLRF